MLNSMLFALVFTVHGSEFTILSGVSIHTCVGRLIYERKAIEDVNKIHPELAMTVSCQPMKTSRKEIS